MFKLEDTLRALEFKRRNGTLFPGRGGRYDPPSPPRPDPDYVPRARAQVYLHTADDDVQDTFTLWVNTDLEQPGVPLEVTHYHLLSNDLRARFKQDYDEAVRTGAFVPPNFPALPPPSD